MPSRGVPRLLLSPTGYSFGELLVTFWVNEMPAAAPASASGSDAVLPDTRMSVELDLQLRRTLVHLLDERDVLHRHLAGGQFRFGCIRPGTTPGTGEDYRAARGNIPRRHAKIFSSRFFRTQGNEEFSVPRLPASAGSPFCAAAGATSPSDVQRPRRTRSQPTIGCATYFGDASSTASRPAIGWGDNCEKKKSSCDSRCQSSSPFWRKSIQWSSLLVTPGGRPAAFNAGP